MSAPALHRVVCGALVRGAALLLVHRRADRRHFPNVWDLPGGHVEPGEEPVAALVRELGEELGVTARGLAARPAAHLQPSPDLDLSAWVVTAWDGEPRNLEPTEHDDLRWWPVSELDRVVQPGPWDVPTLQLLGAAGRDRTRLPL